MENKVNIAKLLKDCPKGMELDCTTWENVTFEKVIDNKIFIKRNDKPSFDNTVVLNKYGCTTDYPDEKCRIFPKGKTTWEEFQRPFKDGDIIFTHANCLKIGLGNTWISIFQEKRNGGVATYVNYAEDGSDFYAYEDKGLLCMNEDIMHQRLATEEEKQKLFQAIKDNGYKWNAETKTLEKLIESKFKVGDKIKKNKDYISGIITNISDDGFYKVEYLGARGSISYINIAYQDDWELVPDKFDVTKLKPFDKVLVRNTNKEYWMISMFGYILNDDKQYFMCTTKSVFYQCIPYEGNEHLLGTTNDCDEFYKTWK